MFCWWWKKPSLFSPFPLYNLYSVNTYVERKSFGRFNISSGMPLPVRNRAISFEKLLQLFSNIWYELGLLFFKKINKKHIVRQESDQDEQQKTLLTKMLIHPMKKDIQEIDYMILRYNLMTAFDLVVLIDMNPY